MGRDNGHGRQGDHDQDRGMDHWTISHTNHHRRSLRSEVKDDVVEHLKRTIVQALERGEEPHVGETFPNFRVRKNPEPHPGLLSVTLFHETAGAVLRLYINAGGGPKPEAWAHAWRNGNAPEPTPEGAWCVDDLVAKGLLELSPMQQIETAVWSGDFARCLAWAVIETESGG